MSKKLDQIVLSINAQVSLKVVLAEEENLESFSYANHHNLNCTSQLLRREFFFNPECRTERRNEVRTQHANNNNKLRMTTVT